VRLNPNICKVVALLRANGFDTMDSGDGQTHDYECDLPIPYVHSRVDSGAMAREADRMQALFEAEGIAFNGIDEDGNGVSVEATYSSVDGIATVSLFGVHDGMLR